jgi:transcriptional regulator with XRE-family HTH domain
MDITINESLRKIREVKGYSQKFVAKKLKTYQKRICYMETMQKIIPDDILKQFADLYEVPIEFIKNFDPNNFLHTNLSDQQNLINSIERMMYETKFSVEKMHEEIKCLHQKISAIEKRIV